MSSCSAAASPVLRRRTACTCRSARAGSAHLSRRRSPGGKIVTERIDGFVIEGGPDSFLATKPRGIGLCEELGIGEPRRCTARRQQQRRRAFVLWRGRLHDLPEGLSGLVPTRLAPLVRSTLLSPLGKARVALDYLLPARRAAGDESLGGFVSRRLGREAWSVWSSR